MSWKEKPVNSWTNADLGEWMMQLKPRLQQQKPVVVDEKKLTGQQLLDLDDNGWSNMIPNKLLCKLLKREVQKIQEANKDKVARMETQIHTFLNALALIPN